MLEQNQIILENGHSHNYCTVAGQNAAQIYQAEFWEGLMQKLHFLDIKILEYVYVQESGASYFSALEKAMSRMNIKRTAIRNHINKLERLGLIKTVRSGVLLVNSVNDISANVGNLVNMCKYRWKE